MDEATNQRQLTFGERAVGLNFNPAQDPKVANKAQQQAFREGQLDCQKAGRIDNHVAYKETVRELLQELMEQLPTLTKKTPDNSYNTGYDDAITEAEIIIQNKLEGLS